MICCRMNEYFTGELISKVILGIHAATFMSDILMRCCKKKGTIRSFVKFFTVRDFYKNNRYIEFEFQILRCSSNFDIYIAVFHIGKTSWI